MGLETGTYIDDLDASNPTASDNVSQGDDHIRLLKSTILATFPNITGAMTMTEAQLNQVSDLLTQVPTLETEQASTSGTSIDFTSIPSWVKKITIQFVGVSTDGTSDLIVQLGDAGGIEATGYLGAGWISNVTNQNYTDGICATAVTAATSIWHGTVTLTLEDSANFTWVGTTIMATSNAASMSIAAGSKSLSAALDRVRITTQAGTDNFDAGAINIRYER